DGIRDKLVTGVQTCALPISGGALGGVGGYLAETIGWRGGFTLLGAIGIGYALVLLIFLRDADEGESAPVHTETRSRVGPRQALRSEERRVGKEGRARGSRDR